MIMSEFSQTSNAKTSSLRVKNAFFSVIREKPKRKLQGKIPDRTKRKIDTVNICITIERKKTNT